MKKDMREKLKKKLVDIAKSGKTALDKFGIDGDLMSKVEKKSPHIAKQYPYKLKKENTQFKL